MGILLPEEVHIWSARQPSTLPPDIEATLSLDERARASRFHFAEHRLGYVFAHAVLRDVLSRYLQCSLADIRFAENAFGKPFLDDVSTGLALEFNLSHSGGLVLVGLCCGRRIGIDVEEVRPMQDMATIAKSYFTTQESTFILSEHRSGRESAFWSCWTRKEAYVKAVGKGLSIPLNSFDTLISGRGSTVLLESGPGSTDHTTWQVTNLDLAKGYVMAVAVETALNRLEHFEWRASVRKNYG